MSDTSPSNVAGSLPPRLRPRVTPVTSHEAQPEGEFVLCWLHHAVRGHENPVLDAAVLIGNTLGKPVLVYQGLGGRHRYNSDRHHTFIMEGARDLQAELAERGLAYAFHLPRNPSQSSPLRGLAERSCLVVTEDFPAPPFPRWTKRLADGLDRSVLAVDGSCLAPIRTFEKRYTRAFKFRDAAKGIWRSEIAAHWPNVEPEVDPMRTDKATLGFEAIDLRQADMAELCAECDIDHGVPPVGRIRGGSVAGYDRWKAFERHHLSRYDRRRNDAADMDAVSGLSPYLHHGHVSPFRIAREANERGGKGAEKFLDELLVWRELAFNFCVHTPEEPLESMDALPDWAQHTLQTHKDDPREATYSWETLARGSTGHRLWDEAQRSLVQNGELHNNLRMTWGKAIAEWTRAPHDALTNLIDLNHRYALDGSNPNSYGGLLWCLGQFDRPFSPERPVLGAVRGRSVDEHAERLDPTRFAAAVTDRQAFAPLNVAVIGAGFSGLTCARVLQEQGCSVTVFDRGRVPGGRLATRPLGDEADTPIDHGCPSFHVTDPRFGRYVRSWIEDGVCARWPAVQARWDGSTLAPLQPEAPLVVGALSMRALVEHLAVGIEVRTSTVVASIVHDRDGWTLSIQDEPDAGPFDALVLATAPEQALRLADPANAIVCDALRTLSSVPIWAGLFAVDLSGNDLPDVIDLRGHKAIDTIVRSDRKPGRPSNRLATLTGYAHPEWSAERYSADRNSIATELQRHTAQLLSEILGTPIDADQLIHGRAHRWGLARPASPLSDSCLFDESTGLAVCADGLGGSGVEAAFLSARAAAGRVLSLRKAARSAESLFAD